MTHAEYKRAIADLGDGAIITVRFSALSGMRSITGRYRQSPPKDPDCLYIGEGDRVRHIMYHRVIDITPEFRRAA